MSDTAESSKAPQEMELCITDLGWEGEGVARTPEGRVVFVPGVLPGDRALVRLLPAPEKGPLRGSLLNLVEPAANRISHPCPHAADGCPASPLGCWDSETAADWKKEHLHQTLRRIGGISDVPVEPVIRSDSDWQYRDRLEFSVEVTSDGPKLGYRASGGALVPLTQCLLGQEAVSEALGKLAEKTEGEWSEPGATVRLLLRSNGRDGVVGVLFFTDAPGGIPKLDSYIQWLDRGDLAGWQIRSSSTVAARYFRSTLLNECGDSSIHLPVAGETIALSPVAFGQANVELGKQLVSLALQQLEPTDSLADLYGGFGPFALEHAARGGRAEVFESNPEAIHAGQEFARAHELAVLYHQQNLEQPGHLDLSRFGAVIVDPPRSGLTRPVIEALNNRGPRRLIYISCHPAALARDCARLSEYRPQVFLPVDMFPGTPDLETIAVLKHL